MEINLQDAHRYQPSLDVSHVTIGRTSIGTSIGSILWFQKSEFIPKKQVCVTALRSEWGAKRKLH